MHTPPLNTRCAGVRLTAIAAAALMLTVAPALAAAAPAGTVLHYSFDDTNNLFNDSSGNGYHGDPVNGTGNNGNYTEYGTGDALFSGNVPFGNAVNLRDDSGGIDITGLTESDFSGSGDNATMAIWFKEIDGNTFERQDQSFGGTNTGQEHWFTDDFDPHPAGYFNTFRENSRVSNVDYSIADQNWSSNEWHHLAIVNDTTNNQYRVYMDAVLVETATPDTFDLGNVQLDDGGGNSSVAADELWFLDQALDQAGVERLMTRNTVIPEPATLALLGLGGLALVGRRERG